MYMYMYVALLLFVGTSICVHPNQESIPDQQAKTVLPAVACSVVPHITVIMYHPDHKECLLLSYTSFNAVD